MNKKAQKLLSKNQITKKKNVKNTKTSWKLCNLFFTEKSFNKNYLQKSYLQNLFLKLKEKELSNQVKKNNKTNKKTPDKQINKQTKQNKWKYFQYFFRDYYEVINRIVKKARNSTDLEKSLKTFKSHSSIRRIKMIKYDNTKFSFYHVQ